MKLLDDTHHKVYVATVQRQGRRFGFVLTWLTPASLNRKTPMFVMIVSKANASLRPLEETGSFGLNLLASHQVDEFCRFGLESSREMDKFEGFLFTDKGTGIELDGGAAYGSCKIESVLETPDRKIFYCSLQEQSESEKVPMVLAHILDILPAFQKERLSRKFEEDALRDEAQFL